MNCVIKLYNNECWFFYYNTSNGLCFSTLDSEGVLTDNCILSHDAIDDFDAVCDDNDNLHLCCQSNSGEIVYYRYINNDWNKSIILKSKSTSVKQKQFKIFSINNWINIFYILEYRGKNLLVHHILDKTGKEPEIVDYIGESYTASKDSYGNIYIYYDSETKASFGFKKYEWSKKEWSEFFSLQQYDNSNSFLNMFDVFGTPLFIISKNKAVHFIKDDTDKIISTGDKPVIFRNNNTYSIQWKYKGKIYSAVSKNNCINWEKCGSYNISNNSTPEIFRISISNRQNNISCEYCYGYVKNNRVFLLGLDGLATGINDSPDYTIPSEATNSVTEYEFDTSINSGQIQQTIDYNIQLNKIIIALNLLNESNVRIEKNIVALEKEVSDFKKIIKELPDGSSKKHWFIRG